MTPTRRVLPTALAGTVLLVTAAAAKRGVPMWERRVYAAINDLPDGLAPAVWPPMQFGSFPAPFVVGAMVFRRHRRPDQAVSLIAAGVTAWLAAKGAKRLIGRGRPYDFDQETNLRLWTEVDGSLGYVSGHAAVAMATAGILHRSVSPPVAAGAYGLAAVVGLSRIYVGAHFPVDVIGGAALGVLIAELVTQLGPNGPGRFLLVLPDSA